ncbi:MAG: DNA topoisomerase VI subunit B [Candidatus Aenigmatarchaeota archaeon]
MAAYDFKIAERLAREQREISVAEFFEKNSHLLGFDNPAKSLLTVVKEAVDNSLDACQDAGILPDIHIVVKEPRKIFRILTKENVEIGRLTIDGDKAILQIDGEHIELEEKKERKKHIDYIFKYNKRKYKVRKILDGKIKVFRGRKELRISKIPSDRYLVKVEDNGPGIIKTQIPRIFGKLLYGSKFYKLKQTRGQQGIGISAAVLYSQLTTGKPVVIYSRVSPKKPIYLFKLRIDTTTNEPIIIEQKIIKDGFRDHGVRIEMEIEGKYIQRYHSIEEYLKETAIVNPFAKITYEGPNGEKIEYSRVIKELPEQPLDIRPHPYGVEIGMLERMLKLTKARNLSGFLSKSFCRIGSGTADQICKLSNLRPNRNPKKLNHEEIERLWRIMQSYKFMKPPTNCLSPIGEKELEEGLKKEYNVEFAAAVSRPPNVYRGMPFAVEVGMAYGGELPPNKSGVIMRFSNRVPLLYQASSCAITRAIQKINWRSYGLDQQGNFPFGPLIIAVHVYSVWIPYTSESKEAIDPYPIIVKEIKLALQDCGRKLKRYLSGRKRIRELKLRQSLFEKYIPEVSEALSKISGTKKEVIERGLKKILRGNKNE